MSESPKKTLVATEDPDESATPPAKQPENLLPSTAEHTPPPASSSSNTPNRAIELPGKSSQPLPSSQESKKLALLVDGLPELPLLSPEARYQVEGEFARGGLGRIIRAHDERMDRPVAMKEMLRRTGGNAEKRFLREAIITAQLEHPSIIPVHDLGRWSTGAAYYTMKMVSGQSFDRVIAEAKSVEARIALLPHVIAASEAIAYAHSKSIIHRDLKPGNILVGAFGETLVIDWGIAKNLTLNEPQQDEGNEEEEIPQLEPYREDKAILQDQLTKAGAIIGTPAYMPLEQARGHQVDARADVYALGAILYHLMCGKPPYVAKKSFEVLQKLFDGPPVEITEREPTTPKDLAAIIHKAMDRTPEARYPSAQELVEDLKLFQTGQLVGAHQYSLPEVLSRWVKKNRIFLSAAALFLVLFILVLTWNYLEIRGERNRALLAQKNERVAKEQEATLRISAETKEKLEFDRVEQLKLDQARAMLEKNPLMTLAWLKTIRPTDKTPWGAIRTIAADALSRGVPTVLGATWNDSGEGHTEQINSLSFSPDDSLLASTSNDHTIKLWDVKEKKLRYTLKGHTDYVQVGRFSPDGKLFVSAGAAQDPTIRVWEVASGKQLSVLTGHSGVIWDLTFSPDGKIFATAGEDGVIRLWNTAQAQQGNATPQELRGHSKEIRSICFSHDGKMLTSAGFDGRVFIWEIETGKNEIVFQQTNDLLFTSRFSSDNAYLAISGITQDTAETISILFEVKTKKITELKNQPEGAWNITFSSDNQFIATAGGNNTATVWNINNCTEKSCLGDSLQAHQGNILDVLFTKNNKTIITSSYDHTIKLWDTQTKKYFATLRNHQEAVTLIALSSDDKYLASASKNGELCIWNFSEIQGETLYTPNSIQEISLSKKNNLLSISWLEENIPIWDISKQKKVKTIINKSNSVKLSVFSPSGNLFVASNENNGIDIFNTSSWERTQSTENHDDILYSLSFSKDETKIVSTSRDKKIKIWDTTTAKVIHTIEENKGEVYSAVFSDNGKTIVSINNSHYIEFYDAVSGVKTKDISTNGSWVIRYSPKGNLLAFAGGSSSLWLWPLQSSTEPIGEPLALQGHLGDIVKVAFSPDGASLASASWDDTARLWDIASHESRSLPSHGGDVETVAFSPDGQWLAIAGDDSQVHLYPDQLPKEPTALEAWLSGLQLPSPQDGSSNSVHEALP